MSNLRVTGRHRRGHTTNQAHLNHCQAEQHGSRAGSLIATIGKTRLGAMKPPSTPSVVVLDLESASPSVPIGKLRPDSLSTGRAQSGPQIAVAPHAQDRMPHGGRTPRVEVTGRLAADRVCEVQVTGKHRHVEAHRLQIWNAKRLEQRRHEQRVDVFVVRGRFTVRDQPQVDDAVTRAEALRPVGGLMRAGLVRQRLALSARSIRFTIVRDVSLPQTRSKRWCAGGGTTAS
jgi:hypothetical protein